MAEVAQANKAKPTLAGWVARDALITLSLIAVLWALHIWHADAGGALSTVVTPTIGFIAAYILCYIYHEWGHLVGASWSGGHMPLAPYAGPIIGTFAIAKHSRTQFLWLSWGGVTAYVTIMVIAVGVYVTGTLGSAGAGLAVGGLAFVSQSLAVDLPQILAVRRGADIATTSAAGASAQIILRRTWQTWIPLAALLAVWNLVFH